MIVEHDAINMINFMLNHNRFVVLNELCVFASHVKITDGNFVMANDIPCTSRSTDKQPSPSPKHTSCTEWLKILGLYITVLNEGVSFSGSLLGTWTAIIRLEISNCGAAKPTPPRNCNSSALTGS